MIVRKLVVFKHNDALGNMPSHKLFERVTIDRVKGESGTPASSFDDYAIKINKEGLEGNGVTVTEIV